MTAFLAGLAAGLALAVLIAWRARRRVRQLQQTLAASGARLERLQQAFSRFAPSEVVDRIIAGQAGGQAEVKEITALFCDLVGYTALSEQLEPATLLEVVNGYFEAMSREIVAHNGHVATFLGDGILAYFGALAPNPWQSNDAAAAALAMREALDEYNRSLTRQGRPALRMGIGLYRGSGLAGLVGSRDRTEYSVMGRTINLASRIQDLTRECDADILLSASVREHLDPRYRLQEMPAVAVKGVEEPVVTWALTGRDETPL